MTIKKFNIDINRQMVTILLDDNKIITITNSNQQYDLLLNKFVNCNNKKFIDVTSECVLSFIQ